MALEEAECGLRLAGRRRVQLALQREEFGRCGEGAAGHRHDRGARCEPCGQLEYLLAGALVERQQQARDGRGAGAVRGQCADHQIRPVPGRDHQTAGRQRVQEIRQHRTAEDEVQRVPGQPRVVAEQHGAAERGGDLGDGRRGERGVVRQDRTRHGQPCRQPLGDDLAVLGRHPVHHHREDVAAQTGVRPVGVARLGPHGLRVLPLPADHRDHRGTELIGQPGIERQLVGELGGREVGAEDQHHLVHPGHLMEAVDEPRDQLVGTLLRLQRGRLRIVQAIDRRRVLAEPVAGPQQLEQPVGAVVDQRTEHPDPVHLTCQELHDSQIDDLAAVSPVDPRHVHAARHACSPVVLAGWCGIDRFDDTCGCGPAAPGRKPLFRGAAHVLQRSGAAPRTGREREVRT